MSGIVRGLSFLLVAILIAQLAFSSDLEVECSVLHVETKTGTARGLMRIQVSNRSDREFTQISLSLASPGEDQIEGAPFQVVRLDSGETADQITAFRFGEESSQALEALVWLIEYQDGEELRTILVRTRENEEEGTEQ